MNNEDLLGNKARLILVETEQAKLREILETVKLSVEQMLALYVGLCDAVANLCVIVRNNISE